jgi:hypothetical protein
MLPLVVVVWSSVSGNRGNVHPCTQILEKRALYLAVEKSFTSALKECIHSKTEFIKRIVKICCLCLPKYHPTIMHDALNA